MTIKQQIEARKAAAALAQQSGDKPAEPAPPVVLTPAQARLEKFRTRSATAVVKRVEIDGDAWFLRRVNLESLTRITMLSPRQRSGLLDLTGKENFSRLLASMLFVCCVSGEVAPANDEPFFESWEEAHDQAVEASADAVQANGLLFNKILALNPEILPQVDVKQAEKDALEAEAALKKIETDAAPLGNRQQRRLNGRASKGKSGGNATASTAAPSS